MERRSSTLNLGVGLVGEAQVKRWIMQGWRQKARGPWSSAWRVTEGEKARGHGLSVGKWLGESSWWRWCTVSSSLILLRREREGHLMYSFLAAQLLSLIPFILPPHPAPLRQKAALLGVCNHSQFSLMPLSKSSPGSLTIASCIRQIWSSRAASGWDPPLRVSWNTAAASLKRFGPSLERGKFRYWGKGSDQGT